MKGGGKIMEALLFARRNSTTPTATIVFNLGGAFSLSVTGIITDVRGDAVVIATGTTFVAIPFNSIIFFV